MTRKSPAAAAAPDRERPRGGGSYIRQKDGTLKRVKFTEYATAGHPAPDGEAELGDAQGGGDSSTTDSFEQEA